MKNAPNNGNISPKKTKKCVKSLFYLKNDTSNSHFAYFCICF